MTPLPAASDVLRRRWARCVAACLLALAGLGGAVWTASSQAQGASASAVAREQGVHWAELNPSQQNSLRPLQQEWATLDLRQKEKWLALASRFQKLPPEERARIQTRMSEWARLGTKERAQARQNYQEARQLPREDREARWKAYQALSPEERQQLAERAAAGKRAGVRGGGAGNGRSVEADYAARPRPIGPVVVQAAPGATTTLLTRSPTPPGHQQTGMPRIAATPGFVDKATLLPQRGPQGAAVRAAPAATSEPPRHP